MRTYFAGRVYASDVSRRCCRFRETLLDICLRVQPLPLEVTGLEVIAVDQNKPAYTGSCHRAGLEATEGSAPDYRNGGGRQTFLAMLAESLEADLTRVTFPLVRSHTP